MGMGRKKVKSTYLFLLSFPWGIMGGREERKRGQPIPASFAGEKGGKCG